MSKRQERINIHHDLVHNYGWSGAEAGAIANKPNIHDAHKAYRRAKAAGPRTKPVQPQAPPPPKPVAPVKPPLRISKGNVGVRQNKKKKSKANSLSIARSANVIPLQQGAVGYQGLRIS
tara:strand:+ start:3146 stop:3502 length:357 start_codon:yes stop_codon:yes gene_type:complete